MRLVYNHSPSTRLLSLLTLPLCVLTRLRQVFFPRSLISEAGYAAKSPSAPSQTPSVHPSDYPEYDHRTASLHIDTSFPTLPSSPKSLAPTSLIQSPIYSPAPTPIQPFAGMDNHSQPNTPVFPSSTPPFHTSTPTSVSNHGQDTRFSSHFGNYARDSPSISIHELSEHGHIPRQLHIVIDGGGHHGSYDLRGRSEDHHDLDLDYDEPAPGYNAPYHEQVPVLPIPAPFTASGGQARNSSPVRSSSPHLSVERAASPIQVLHGLFGAEGMMRRTLREQRSAPMALSARISGPLENTVQCPNGGGIGAGNASRSASERAIGIAVRGPRPVGLRHARGRSSSGLHPFVRIPILVSSCPWAGSGCPTGTSRRSLIWSAGHPERVDETASSC